MSYNKKQWLKNTAIKAVKTIAQTMCGFITVNSTFAEINWGVAVSTAVLAGVYSVLMSLANIPGGTDNEDQ